MSEAAQLEARPRQVATMSGGYAGQPSQTRPTLYAHADTRRDVNAVEITQSPLLWGSQVWW